MKTKEVRRAIHMSNPPQLGRQPDPRVRIWVTCGEWNQVGLQWRAKLQELGAGQSPEALNLLRRSMGF